MTVGSYTASAPAGPRHSAHTGEVSAGIRISADECRLPDQIPMFRSDPDPLGEKLTVIARIPEQQLR